MLKQQGRRLSVGMIVDGGSRNPPGIDIAMINEQRETEGYCSGVMCGEESQALASTIQQTQCIGVITYHHGDRLVIKNLKLDR